MPPNTPSSIVLLLPQCPLLYKDYTFFEYQKLRNPDADSEHVTVDWGCTVYVYVAGANPDSPSFAESGGMVHVLLVHRGNLDPLLLHRGQDVKLFVKPEAGCAVPVRQLPTYSTKDGENWQMKIKYRERIQMFGDSGNTLEPFEAEYVHEYQLEKMEQTGEASSDQIQLYFGPNSSSKWQTPRELNGLSVLHWSDPGKSPLQMTFEVKARFDSTIAKSTIPVTIDLGS
ncbi:hypothetical protein ONZ45_g5984 [Pleurotus djamor]|nr:hypothetical protein ONZ45_g5984 [Pleurotus djamor]